MDSLSPFVALIFVPLLAIYLYEMRQKIMREKEGRRRIRERIEVCAIGALFIITGVLFLLISDFSESMLVLDAALIGGGAASFAAMLFPAKK